MQVLFFRWVAPWTSTARCRDRSIGRVLGPALVLLALASRAVGQGLLTGQVTDSLGVPLPGASVYLTARGGGAGLVYGHSDTDGAYRLACPPGRPDTLLLQVRALGFRPLTQRVVLAGSAQRVVPVALRAMPTQLNEVVVRAHRPGIRYNDTTTYEAKQFADGTSRTLENLLRNVPGFEVSADGKISYKGKEIAGLYVEGDNLTGANYQRITRNLSAALVEKIQPIERFVENKLLGGLVRSETTVLNITIPADQKKPLFGQASAGLALPHYRDASANLFSYHKRSKLYFIGTHNNIGLKQDPVALALSSPAGGVLRSEVAPVRPLLAEPMLTADSFRPDLSTLNNETTGGLIHVLKPADAGWKLLTDLSLYADQLHQTRRADTRYLLSDTTFLRLGEVDRSQQTRTAARLRNNLFVPLGEKANLTYENRLTLLRTASANAIGLTTEVPHATLTENIGAALRSQPVQLGQNVLLTNRLSETSALQTQLVHTYDYVPQLLSLESDLPARRAAYLGRPLPDAQIQQAAHTTQHALGAESEYSRIGRVLNFSAVLGAEYVNSALQTRLTAQTDAGADSPAAYANDLTVRRGQLYGQVRFNQTVGRLTISGAVGGAVLRLAVRNAADPEKPHCFGYPTGQLAVELGVGRQATLRATYAFDQRFSAPEELLGQSVLVDFRTFTQGLAAVFAQPEHRIGLAFNYQNNASLTKIQAAVQLTQRTAAFSQSLQLDGLLSRSALFRGPGTQGASAQITVAQFLDNLSLRVQLENATTYTESYNTINNSPLRRNQLIALRTRLQVGTAFAGPVNLFGGGTLITNAVRVQVASTEPAAARNARFQLDFQAIIRYQHFTATVRTDQLFINRAAYSFLGAEAHYAPVQSRLTYSLTLKNLLGTEAFTQVAFSNLLTTTTSYDLLPRLIMPGLSYRF